MGSGGGRGGGGEGGGGKRADEGGQVYGQAARPAVPRMEDIPPQSRRRHRRDGSVLSGKHFSPEWHLSYCFFGVAILCLIFFWAPERRSWQPSGPGGASVGSTRQWLSSSASKALKQIHHPEIGTGRGTSTNSCRGGPL